MRLDELSKMLLICKDKGIELNRRDRVVLKAAAACPNDRHLYLSALRRIEIKVVRKGLNRSLFAVPPGMTGNLNLGQNAAGATWVKLGGPQAHILQVAGSGSGKTNNNRLWLLQLAETAQGMIITDLAKKEYRPLVSGFAQRGKRLYVCHGRQTCVGALRPPHRSISPANWGGTFSDTLTLALQLPPASSNFLRVIIHQVQEDHGVFAGSEKHPTLFEIRDAVRTSPGSMMLKNAVLNRMDALIAELGPDVLGDRHGFSIPELCNCSIDLELDGLSYFAQNFLIAYFLGAIFAYRINCPEERRGMVVFCLDEARRIFSQRAETSYSEGPSYFATMASLVRGADLTLIVSVQTTDDLSRSIIANSSVKVMGRLGDYLDYERMGRCMGMTSEQIEFCKRRLRPGVYAVKAGGDFGEPFIIKNRLLDLPEGISDKEAEESGEALRRHLMSPKYAETGEVMSSPDPEAVLSAEEMAYLAVVCENPLLPSTEYAPLAGISNKQSLSIRKSLGGKGFLTEWPVELSASGPKSILLELHEEPGRSEPHPGRKGNFVHQLTVERVGLKLKSEGYELEFERHIVSGDRDGYLDIYGIHHTTGATVGAEIETEAGHGLGNLRKALAVPLTRIIMVGCTRRVRNEMEKLARKEFPDGKLSSVTFTALCDYWKGRRG